MPIEDPTELADSIREVWIEMLEVQGINNEDDFFALGGDSLVASRVTVKLRRMGFEDLALRTIFEHPTFGDFVRCVSR